MYEELKLLGLNDNEVRIYISLLDLGEAPASLVAKKSEIPRASIYDILERLQEKGMVSAITKDCKKYFLASPPETLIHGLEYSKRSIERIMPELIARRQNHQEVFRTEVYRGTKGMQAILNQILDEKEILVLGASQKTREVMPYFMEHWHRERERRKIKVKIIYNDSSEVRREVTSAKKKIFGKDWNARFLSTDYLSPVMTVVFGNKVMLGMWKSENVSAVLIESKDVASTYRQHFMHLWNMAQ